MKKPSDVFKEFQKFLTLQVGIVNKLTFPYPDIPEGEHQKKQIAFAMTFWEFSRRMIKNERVSSMAEKRDFLFFFMKNEQAVCAENRYLKIIAMTEALPTKVWRRLLWRENIDFVSDESFLRRLNGEQIKAIEDNFNDLFPAVGKPRTPRVFKKTLRDRFKVFFRAITVKKLLTEEEIYQKRYLTKGAWAFNLLGIDFGFALYPKGENDDRKITNQKFTRFLSVKEHINDFVVNQEDGVYWGLYRSARSNYAFYPNKVVKLRDHVCPGFWWTFLVQAMFWILSPAMLALSGKIVVHHGLKAAAILPLVGALPMIIWGLVAFGRVAVKLLSYCSKPLKIIGYCILAVIVIAVAGVVLILLYALTLWLFGVLSPVLGIILAGLTIAIAYFYVFFFGACIMPDETWFDYDDIPIIIRIVLPLTLAVAALVAGYKYLTPYVVRLAQAIWQWYMSNLFLTNWLIFSIIFFGVFFFAYRIYLKNERRFVKFRKIFIWINRVFLILTTIFIGIEVAMFGGLIISAVGLWPVVILAVVVVALGYSLIMLDKVNPSNIEERERAWKFLHRLDDELGVFASKSYIRDLLNSPWLRDLDFQTRWETVDDIRYLANSLFYKSRTRLAFSELMAERGSLEVIKILFDKSGKIKTRGYTEWGRLKIVNFVIDGLSVDEAIQQMWAKRSAAKKARERTLEIMATIFWVIVFPFYYAGKGIAWVLIRIGRFFLSLKDLISFFNKMCPYVYKPRLLE